VTWCVRSSGASELFNTGAGSAGCGVGSAARTTGAGSVFFVAGSEFLTLLPLAAGFGFASPEVSASDSSSLGDADLPDTAVAAGFVALFQTGWNDSSESPVCCSARLARVLSGDGACIPTAAIEIGTPSRMHAVRQKEIVSYRYARAELQDVILLPVEFHVQFSSSKWSFLSACAS
jgi:hypothetical protein